MQILNIGPLELLAILIVMFILLGPKGMITTAQRLGSWIRSLVRSPIWKEIMGYSQEIRELPQKLMDDTGLKEAITEVQQTTTLAATELNTTVNDAVQAARIPEAENIRIGSDPIISTKSSTEVTSSPEVKDFPEIEPAVILENENNVDTKEDVNQSASPGDIEEVGINHLGTNNNFDELASNLEVSNQPDEESTNLSSAMDKIENKPRARKRISSKEPQVEEVTDDSSVLKEVPKQKRKPKTRKLKAQEDQADTSSSLLVNPSDDTHIDRLDDKTQAVKSPISSVVSQGGILVSESKVPRNSRKHKEMIDVDKKIIDVNSESKNDPVNVINDLVGNQKESIKDPNKSVRRMRVKQKTNETESEPTESDSA